MLRRSRKSFDLTELETEAKKRRLKANGSRYYTFPMHFFVCEEPQPLIEDASTNVITPTTK